MSLYLKRVKLTSSPCRRDINDGPAMTLFNLVKLTIFSLNRYNDFVLFFILNGVSQNISSTTGIVFYGQKGNTACKIR